MIFISLILNFLESIKELSEIGTFGDECVLACARCGTVDFPNDLHIVEERVKSIKEGKANHVSSASSHDLQTREPIYHLLNAVVLINYN